MGAFNELPLWFRALLGMGFLGGSLGGAEFITSDDSDRYYASTAAQDLRLRDQQIIRIQKDIDKLEGHIVTLSNRIQQESREAEDDLKAHLSRERHRPE